MDRKQVKEAATIKEVLWFPTSPETGHPDCICSLCVRQIAQEDGPPIRVWPEDASAEARFHIDCFFALIKEGAPDA